MRTLPVAALAILLSGAALASPIDGRWVYDMSACTPETASGDVGPNVFAGNTLTYYESECTITKVTPIGNQERSSAWRIKAACSGEGENWTTDSVYGIERDRAGNVRSLVEIDMKEGYVNLMLPCK